MKGRIATSKAISDDTVSQLVVTKVFAPKDYGSVSALQFFTDSTHLRAAFSKGTAAALNVLSRGWISDTYHFDAGPLDHMSIGGGGSKLIVTKAISNELQMRGSQWSLHDLLRRDMVWKSSFDFPVAVISREGDFIATVGPGFSIFDTHALTYSVPGISSSLDGNERAIHKADAATFDWSGEYLAYAERGGRIFVSEIRGLVTPAARAARKSAIIYSADYWRTFDEMWQSYALAFDPERKIVGVVVTVSGARQMLYVVDLKRGRLRGEFQLSDQAEKVGVVAVHPDGTLLVAGNNKRVVIWSLARNEVIWQRDTSGSTALAISDDGRTIAIGNDDGSIDLWSFP